MSGKRERRPSRRLRQIEEESVERRQSRQLNQLEEEPVVARTVPQKKSLTERVRRLEKKVARLRRKFKASARVPESGANQEEHQIPAQPTQLIASLPELPLTHPQPHNLNQFLELQREVFFKIIQLLNPLSRPPSQQPPPQNNPSYGTQADLEVKIEEDRYPPVYEVLGPVRNQQQATPRSSAGGQAPIARRP